MCISVRGGTFYGASLHITIGLIFLAGFFVDLLGIAEIWHNPYATYFTLILAFLYIILFLVFGILIFRGTEKESDSLLKGSIAGFISLQISAFFVYLIILAITNSIRNERIVEAVQRLNATDPAILTSITDLKAIEAILNEASNELKANNQSVIHEIVLLEETTPSPLQADIDLISSDDEPIISLSQIIIIVVGALATIGYTSVVVMYIREVEDEDSRLRNRC